MEELGLVNLCKGGIFPELPFLIETRDDASLKQYFESPTTPLPDGSVNSEVPLSTVEREKILRALLERFQVGGGVDDDHGEWWRKLGSKSRAYVIVFLSENHDDSKPWSSKECHRLVGAICEKVCSGVEFVEGEELNSSVKSRPKGAADLRPWFATNFKDCLTHHDSDLYNILQVIRGKYSKSKWKHFPASAQGFGWIIKQIPYPFLTNDVDLVIPPALLFTDDYYEDNKRLGLECLSHIVHNVDKGDLTQNNWAHVIYDAVLPLCSEKDPAVIRVVMPILIKALSVIEKDPVEFSSEFTKYDHLLKEIIFIIDTGSDINLKRTWLSLLDSYLNKLGAATIHWSDKLCSMLRDATVCNDDALWVVILQVATTVIKNTWIKTDCTSISEIILRVLLNSATFHTDSQIDLKATIIQNAIHCFELLRKCDGFDEIADQLQEIVETGDTNLLHPRFIEVLKNVLRS